MKRIFILLAAACMMLSACGQTSLKPWTKGGFDTHKYRNVFAEMGYSQKEIDAKLESIYQEVFCGPDKVYFEVGDDMGYMSDVKNYDARTEGMSYGMMVAVQLDKKDGPRRVAAILLAVILASALYYEGLSPDGTIRGAGPASDGELYFVTSLIFASNRWGNDGEINYLAEAQNILNCSWEKDGSEGIMPFINKENHLIIFTPDGRGVSYTDPSYHLPAFYEVWARWADDGRADFWRECAKASREYLHKSIDPETGLNPDTNNFDGSFIETPAFFGRRMKPAFRFDSWRVPMNIALDYSWACADREWQTNYANTIQDFFYSKGIDEFADQYNVDGTEVDFAMPAGMGELRGTGTRHSVGLVSTLAAATLAADHEIAREFAQRLWDSENKPYEDGYFDAYYDGLLRLFAFMHLSGHYRVIEPAK